MLVGKKIGPFDVDKELGSGAMGTVFRARYTKTGQRVAIKIMSPSLGSNATALARFEREGEILKQLKHPNIVRLYATGKYHGSPFYAMEYVEGESLDQVMARRGRMTWEEVVALGKQLCAALQHAHEQGIIHRDLKPSNLMVLPDGTIKLTDFGIAKDLDVTQLTSANCTVGTAAYMSPEQCRGERDLTHKSDLYSMGIVFYELITGRKPFTADTPMDMFLQHVQGPFERPSRMVLDMPIWLDTLICQLMEKKPEQRPLGAAAVGDALDRIQEKVEAQQSAGVDVVRSRIVDHSKRIELDEQDKEAARTLLGKRRKRGRRRRAVPHMSRLWVKGLGLCAVLVFIVYCLYLALKRPSPEALYANAKEVMASTDPDDWGDTESGPIADFLKYYPNRDDDEARQMRAWADQVDQYNRERRLLAWIANGAPVTGDAEQAARDAIRDENAGNLVAARKGWEGLRTHKEDSNRKTRSWGLLAEKRLAGLQAVFDLELKLQGRLDEAHTQLRIFRPGKDAEDKMALALLYEQRDDPWLAHDHWEKLRQSYREKPKKRLWFLLAAKHESKRPPRIPDEPKTRRQRVRDRLKMADEMRKAKPLEARVIYQDIVALYNGAVLGPFISDADPELDILVAQARKRLKEMSDSSH
jgi:serine/threonine-protein kinase